ncbi:proton-conducting transporter transmembrane domain-containing protein [Lignipirellula cremea]|uniref:Probable inorganic carbon transporter subunit DabB n=1 Tax=Lignipirellula cremea TaxID=2528010 RepID=A0A518DKL8_9BACT|nr:proton-conducting transporter membrane subunit [Lignipirellula cremea]QDU92370.1 NADH-quinone oxidoreductase subunit L [Lignipirellula cremea]
MVWFYACLAAGPAILLLSAAAIPVLWKSSPRFVQRSSSTLLFAALGLASAAAGFLCWKGAIDQVFCGALWPVPLNVGVYFDSLSAVMTVLISFIGLIITRYSARYMNGEATQGRFLRWTAFTLGSLLLMVVSRNLVMFTAAWMLASFGLHRLLTHYPDRPWAIWAARKKFLVSRLGDVFLLSALVLTYYAFGTFDYVSIFAATSITEAGSLSVYSPIGWIGAIYVLAAMTKSAQFPFHGWLPDTMEAPTPVSAMMHAGVINAGGFLVIRLSPLVSLSPGALDLLALVGGFTALFGGVVMMTQTSIKRSLAYSTIAQMGFMMLQCGLGAYSAALLHIVAHSLYKAHAFLSSGSVLESAARTRTKISTTPSGRAGLFSLPPAIAVSLGIFCSFSWLFGFDLATKPGAAVLGLILTLALTELLWRSLAPGSFRVALQGFAWAIIVGGGYFGAFTLMDRVLSHSVSHSIATPSVFDLLVLGAVGVGFVGVFVLQTSAGRLLRRPAFQTLYVHAMNGFYLDIPARQLAAFCWGRSVPTP